MISIRRDHAKNVKNWQDGTMALRWCAVGMIEADKQFRRVNGRLHLPALHTALAQHVITENVGATPHNETVNAARGRHRGPPNSGQPRSGRQESLTLLKGHGLPNLVRTV